MNRTQMKPMKLIFIISLISSTMFGLRPIEAEAAVKNPAGKIALMAQVGGDIYLLEGTKLQRVTAGMDPALSADGTQLAFTRWEPEAGVFVRDLKTGVERRVVGAQKPRSPTWRSDGKQLAFVRLLQTVSCRESVLGCFEEGLLRARFGGRDCAPTPAGNLCISEMPQRQIDQTGIVAVGVDGQGWQDLAAPVDAQGVAWRPGRDELLYRGNEALQVTGPGRGTADVVKGARLGGPAWSPDGSQFLAQERMHDHTEIALFDGSGRRLKYLTKPPSATRRAPHNVSPAWSPDGRSILFLTDREAPGVWKLYRMNADGSGQTPYLPQVLKGLTFKYDFVAERVVSWAK